jgi:phosphoglycolate phosphatase-like HAD superfamily hydrolase
MPAADPSPSAETSADTTGPGASGSQREVVVLDIDGVLADVRHRLHYLNRRPKAWDAFFAAAGDDDLLAEGVAVARQAVAGYRIVYLTGRPERIRRATADWLRRHQLPAGTLLMRSNSDHRPSRLMKLERLRRIASSATVALVVDDDADVIATLRAAGFNVMQADWMPKPATDGNPDGLFEVDVLRQAQQELGRT